MAKVDLFNLKERVCALEKEALAALTPSVTANAYPRWYLKNEAGGKPYFINRIAAFTTEEGFDDEGEEMSVYVYTVACRLVVAHVTADYSGELAEANDDYLTQVIEYIDEHELAQSAAYPTAMPYLTRLSSTGGVGFAIFPASPGGVQQAGAEFSFRAAFDKSLIQAYLASS